MKHIHDVIPPITEERFQAQVIELAQLHGWLVYHTHDSMRSEAGFPDLCMVRERVVYAEIKRERGRLTAAQTRWIDVLARAGCAVYVWRPSDFDEIVEILSKGDA